ncbi:MAG: 1-acyl-sn-glycerol-3-phosphate acyltransferase [Candidatus Accumulibacter sp.]|nr:1-acyl-sn-glycerol-3-phosphate acyltransferase [Accumulibacter sp.]
MPPAPLLSPTPYLVRAGRALRVAAHLARALFAAAWAYPRMTAEWRLAYRQRWSRRLLEILEIRLEAGPADAPGGSLIVANHISWLDIFAIDALRPAAFVAKAEIRAWPLIGWLAARNDTIFLDPAGLPQARRINREIEARLDAGFDVAVFPEGRTTDGARLLEFRAALLQAAVAGRRPALPIAISYRDAAGRRSLAPSFAETTLPRCFAAILACRSLTARVAPLAPIDTAGRTRREAARAAHDAIATKLGFPPAKPASETPPDLPA